MTKKAAISGVLPKPRHILPKQKTFWEKEEAKKIKQGFADPEMIPKHLQAKWVPKREKSAYERIAHSAKEPIKSRAKNSDQQRWRNMTADIRREYFKDSHLTQKAKDTKQVSRREEQFRKAREARQAIDHQQESEATRLTLPTIESFFQGKFVKARSAEEKEALQLKRTANRLHHEILHKQQKAAQALELYQQAENFIVSEEKLNEVVDKEFRLVSNDRFGRTAASMLKLHNQSEKLRDQLAQELIGTTSNGQPGLPQVEDTLRGGAHN